jgi:hypothetical protein
MVFIPFTLEEATDIAEDFEDLIDTDFEFDGAVYEVIDVMIAPFEEEEGKNFIAHYSRTKNKEVALSVYTGSKYDVIVFACDIDAADKYTCIDIRTFTDQKGIRYNFPERE